MIFCRREGLLAYNVISARLFAVIVNALCFYRAFKHRRRVNAFLSLLRAVWDGEIGSGNKFKELFSLNLRLINAVAKSKRSHVSICEII